MDLGFYLKTTTVKGRTYAYLARNTRHGPKVVTENLARFGTVDDAQLARLRQWIATDPTLPADPRSLLSDLSTLRIRTSYDYGCEALGHFLWSKLGLHRAVLETLNGVPNKLRCARLIELMVLNRLADPLSKWGRLSRWLPGSAAPLFLGLRVDRLHDNLFYRALDRLWVRQDALERKIHDEIVRPMSAHPEVLYHDTTSTWFEGAEAELGAWGYAPDHRDDRPRVKWGMVVTGEGYPVTLQVFPGNTKDDTTVRPMRERLTRVFGLEGGLYVGDRGMKSSAETADLEVHGFHWILAERNTNVEDVLRAATGRPVAAVSEKNEAREVILDKGRYVVLLNAERRKEELATLARRKAEGEAILTRWRTRVGRLDHHEILKRAQADLAEAHLLDLFDVNFDENTIQGLGARLKEKVAFRRKWAGWWVLKTDTALEVEEVARLYQELAIIERDWHLVKGVLSVRPLYHRLEKRVGAHLVVCELALLVMKYVEQRVKKAELRDEGGQPLSGPGAVECFERLKANEAELPGSGQVRVVVTEPGPLHRAILQALKVDVGKFQGGWARLL